MTRISTGLIDIAIDVRRRGNRGSIVDHGRGNRIVKRPRTFSDRRRHHVIVKRPRRGRNGTRHNRRRRHDSRCRHDLARYGARRHDATNMRPDGLYRAHCLSGLHRLGGRRHRDDPIRSDDRLGMRSRHCGRCERKTDRGRRKSYSHGLLHGLPALCVGLLAACIEHVPGASPEATMPTSVRDARSRCRAFVRNCSLWESYGVSSMDRVPLPQIRRGNAVRRTFIRASAHRAAAPTTAVSAARRPPPAPKPATRRTCRRHGQTGLARSRRTR